MDPVGETRQASPAGEDAAWDRDRAVQAVRALARASSALERSSPNLSLAHYRVLTAVAQGNERASNIAQKLAIGKPTVSVAVESLCQRGLLARSGVAGDQRAAALHLTPAGETLLEQVESEMIIRINDLCDRTPDGGQLIESLVWLGQAMDSRLADRLAARRSESQ
jgi:DNA-binding MarR family transcriptional regulator